MSKVKNIKHKVQINKLPEGFELVNGSLVKKAHGGHVTGDQYEYGLTTFNPHSNDVGGPKDTDVRYSLSSVPRDIANIEAEGGETVLTDLNNNGQFGLYDIKGPRHSSGGVPMFLPEQSFVFSDTQKMKMGKEMLAEHGIKSRKKMTPASVSKQYNLNKYYGLLNDEYADDVQANTAELMLLKNKEGLSKLAFGQEMMKGFDNGVPLAAYPYIQSIGINPFEFAEKIDASMKEEPNNDMETGLPKMPYGMNEADLQAMNPMARYGKEIALYKDGSEYQGTYMDPIVTRDAGTWGDRLNRGVVSLLNGPRTEAYAEGATLATKGFDWLNAVADNTKAKQAQIDLDRMGMTDNAMGVVENDLLSQGVWDTLSGGIYDNMQGNPSVGGGFAGYMDFAQEGVETLGGGTPEWIDWYTGDSPSAKDYRSKRYISYKQRRESDQFKKLAKKKGFSTKILPEEEYHKNYVRGEEQIRAINDLYDKDYLDRSDWDSQYEFDPKYASYAEASGDPTTIKRGKNWRYKKAIEELNKSNRGFTPMTPDEIAQFESGYIGGQMLDEITIEEADRLLAEGRGDDLTKIGDKIYKNLSRESGYAGNTFNRELEEYTPKEPADVICTCLDPETGLESSVRPNDDGTCPPCPPGEVRDIEVPDFQKPSIANIKEPWIQDLIKLEEIQNRRRGLFLPFQPPVRRDRYGAILKDPTFDVAANNAALATALEAQGAFGRGSAGARSNAAYLMGKTADASARTIDQTNRFNIPVANRAIVGNFAAQRQFDALEDARKTKEYDDTVFALQRRMDELNFDDKAYADQLADTITNMSDTYNLNQLYDYFNIAPGKGGDIVTTGYAKPFSKQASKASSAKELQDAIRDVKAAGAVDDKGNVDMKALDWYLSQQEKPFSTAEESQEKQEYRDYLRGYYGAKKGGEKKVKKWATPFYAGKMGM